MKYGNYFCNNLNSYVSYNIVIVKKILHDA